MLAAGCVLPAIGIGIAIVIEARGPGTTGCDFRLEGVVHQFAKDIRATDLADDAACRAALVRIDAEREKWQGYSTESEIDALRTKIQATVDAGNRPR
jgi:hypothetical protein